MPKNKKPVVVVTRKLPDKVELRMRELFDTRLNPDDKPMTAAQLAEAVKTADVMVPTVTDRIDAAVLSKSGEQLKLIFEGIEDPVWNAPDAGLPIALSLAGDRSHPVRIQPPPELRVQDKGETPLQSVAQEDGRTQP